ncbi:TetR/AcrR family transcriptional regulator [Nocardioides ferulae]|uniref:TetR/AcrR family transcriptional regulator n=1 Tax=Nocardioides ferulae TaxID=2340821 RepID=UPI000EB20A11|nr:TetR/AcrR family transcriptional regulator [Nocardioides ferulae]
MTLSAKGTRLNRRGRETRQQLLKVAVRCLATGGPESVSANLVAREAGVTWGTVQHQFGDVDGLWAAVLDYIASRGHLEKAVADAPRSRDLAERVSSVVDMLWEALDLPGSRALYHLRLALPRDRDELEQSFPRTAKAIAAWDAEWRQMCQASFEGLEVDPARLARVTNLLPGAIRGLHTEQHLSVYLDVTEARRGLADALTAYLS